MTVEKEKADISTLEKTGHLYFAPTLDVRVSGVMSSPIGGLRRGISVLAQANLSTQGALTLIT